MTHKLIEACIAGQIDQVKAIIISGVDLNAIVSGETALIMSTRCRQKEIVALLLENGADPNIKTSDTALMISVLALQLSKSLEITKMLLDKNANVNTKNLSGHTALMWASTFKNMGTVELLLESGADIDIKRNDGSSVLLDAAENGFDDWVEFYLKKGADINIQDGKGRTALFSSDIAVVELLLENGADQNIMSDYGDTAFDYAANRYNIPSQVLLKPHTINEQDKNGNTYLIKACQLPGEENIIFLYNKGADFYLDNHQGISAYDLFKNKEDLSPELQALKEQLILNEMIYCSNEDYISNIHGI